MIDAKVKLILMRCKSELMTKSTTEVEASQTAQL
jgi:hypothetical protein